MGLPDIVCFSQLRWEFVFQRPQHLMSRAARTRRVFYVEEPRRTTRTTPYLRTRITSEGVHLCTPYLPRITHDTAPPAIASLVARLLAAERVTRPVVWYSTPMAEPVGRGIDASCRVYDCMDELAAFKSAPRRILEREARLLASADIVFTGGQSLYETKSALHPRVHAFPSAVDIEHFGRARLAPLEPADLAPIRHPRLCFVGVIDERMDLELVAATAEARPEWQVVMIGPVVKIPRRALPRRANLHYLGKKEYGRLPDYLGHVDVAIMPFAANRATRYISPTKTPEYLAAGLPVVSTPIRDVVRGYGERGVVAIASGAQEFVAACERALAGTPEEAALRRRRADELIAKLSWDVTWARMDRLITRAIAARAVERAERASRDGAAGQEQAARPRASTQRRASRRVIRSTPARAVPE